MMTIKIGGHQLRLLCSSVRSLIDPIRDRQSVVTEGDYETRRRQAGRDPMTRK